MKTIYLKNGRPKLLVEFELFDNANPEVWELFKKFAFQAIQSNRSHYSAHAIIHRIRWHVHIETNRTDDFKINNNHFPYYARKFDREFPQYRGFFMTRVAQGDIEVA